MIEHLRNAVVVPPKDSVATMERESIVAAAKIAQIAHLLRFAAALAIENDQSETEESFARQAKHNFLAAAQGIDDSARHERTKVRK